MAKAMPKVSVTAAYKDLVQTAIRDDGVRQSVSESKRDTIWRNHEPAQARAFDQLRHELVLGFAEPEHTYKPLSAADVIARHQR